MDRQFWTNVQYSRRECLELVSVLCSFNEKKVLEIFETVGCPIDGNNIEACHLISKKQAIC